MARRAQNNPRQIRIKSCTCALCTEKFRPGDKPTRRDCTGTWQARYRDPGGKQCAENFPTEKEAQDFLAEVRFNIRRGTYFDPQRAKITLGKWHAERMKKRRGAASTLDVEERMWRLHVEPHFGNWPILKISWTDVDDWVKGLEEVLAASSIPKPFQIVDRDLAAAVRDKRIPFNPCDGISLPKKAKKHPTDRRPPTYAQLDLIRGQLPQHYHALQITAQETGLRWGELAGLRLCNVDLDKGRLEVREVVEDVKGKRMRKEYPKSDAGLRTVPLTPIAVEALREHLQRRPAKSTRSGVEDGMCLEELVFRGPRGAALARTNFRVMWVECLKASGVARQVKTKQGRTEYWPQFHKQRHAYASRLHEAGVPEVVVQEILGHERGGEVTWLYTHAADDTAGQVLAALLGLRPGLHAVA